MVTMVRNGLTAEYSLEQGRGIADHAVFMATSITVTIPVTVIEADSPIAGTDQTTAIAMDVDIAAATAGAAMADPAVMDAAMVGAAAAGGVMVVDAVVGRVMADTVAGDGVTADTVVVDRAMAATAGEINTKPVQ
jgi:hypothetical protein